MEKNPIAKALPDQRTWKEIGLPDLRALSDHETAPAILPGAASLQAAIQALRHTLQITEGGWIELDTVVERVRIDDTSFPHVVEKRQDQRERFALFVTPTLLRPTEVWAVRYDDGTTRNRYIKLFTGSKYDLLVMVKVKQDGSTFWNMMQRDRKGMNALRLGRIIYAAPQ